MLKNAYLDAKIGFDTAENEPSKVRGFLIGVGGVITLFVSISGAQRSAAASVADESHAAVAASA